MKTVKILKLLVLCFGLAVLVLANFGCNDSSKLPDYATYTDVDKLKPKAAAILQEALIDEDARIRAMAIEVVADTERSELMGKVRRLLKDDYVPVRYNAALAVGDLEYHKAKKSVKKLLEDTDGNVRIAAAYALYKLGRPGSFGLLGKAATSKNQRVRANAAVLLGKSGDKSALNLLYWIKDDRGSEPSARLQAAEAIARLGDERIYSKLWTMLISKYIENRIIGVRAMGALGTDKAKDALIRMLNDEVLVIRLVAAEELGKLGYDAGEPEVLDVFTKNITSELEKREIERVKCLATLAIGSIGTPQLTEYLPRLLNDDSISVRIAAAKAVFDSGSKVKSAF